MILLIFVLGLSTTVSTTRIEPKGAHTATVILTHGIGDYSDNWLNVARSWAPDLPHVRWILPRAPCSPVSMEGGKRKPSWYDIEAPTDKFRGHKHCAGIEESASLLNGLIEAERALGTDSSRIVLVGFSQGGGIALWTALHSTSELGGVVVMGGYLPKMHAISPTRAGRQIPVFHCHGTADFVVEAAFAQVSREHALAAGHTGGYELKMYPGLGHWANGEMLADVLSWLKLKLA